MADVMRCLEKLNQRSPLTPEDTSVLTEPKAAGVVKAAVLARLVHRSRTVAETRLVRELAATLPDVAATLLSAFPEACTGHVSAVLPPHPLVVRVLRADWPDSSSRRHDLGAFLQDFVHETLSPMHVAAWLGTVVERGLTPECLRDLTHAMRDSGRVYDYRSSPKLQGRKLVRRYPTGGLSEKTALVLPSVLLKASTQYPVASNFLVARSLGFTGGTWDKLSAIPGFRFPSPGEESIDAMEQCGVAMTVTHGDLNPADRKLYQLRSVTGTIESHELIVSSIASKQLAVPADHLLLDVRYGDGAFLRSLDEARRCADGMLDVITAGGVPCSAHLTDTPQPNGMAIGNALEVAEAIATMGGGSLGPWDPRALGEQRELVLTFYGLLMARAFGTESIDPWVDEARGWFESGEILRAFETLLSAHAVKRATIDAITQNPLMALGLARDGAPVAAEKSGRVMTIDQRRLGHLVNFELGAGGNEYGAAFCARTGVRLNCRIGDQVEAGQPLCWVFGDPSSTLSEIMASLKECFVVA
jgi:pyrimidine-nucleoside phosphorylase